MGKVNFLRIAVASFPGLVSLYFPAMILGRNNHRRVYRFRTQMSAALAALALGYFFFVPFAYNQTLTACRALFPWFFWYDAYFLVSGKLLAGVYLIPALFPTIVTFFAVRRIAAFWTFFQAEATSKNPKTRWRWCAGALLVLIMLFTGISMAALLVWNTLSFGNPLPTPVSRLQKRKCSLCHSSNRPFHYNKTAEQWKLTVRRMQSQNGAPLTDEDVDRIAAFLGKRTSYSDSWMFRAKCLRCHSRSELASKSLTGEEWDLVIGRLARGNVFAFRADWRRQLSRYVEKNLAEALPDDPARKEALRDKIAFERLCGACHTLHFALDVSHEEDRDALVRRMWAKAPALAEEDELPGVLRAFERYRAEAPETWAGAFPHDRKIKVNW